MRVLIVGGGGREHALAWRAAMSPRVEQVFVAPGNAGSGLEPGVTNVDIAAGDIDGLAAFAASERIALTIVGPEAPLVAGIVDTFQARGLACFGPRRAAARLEGSKAFTKAFLERHGIPSAAYQSFSELQPALDFIRERGAPIVVKADGLAAGKGVVVAATVAEAEAAAKSMLDDKAFGDAGARIVVEEFLDGEEASFIVMADGASVVPLATSQDHKARDDGDRGPNTGGMGACSPAPVVTAGIEQRILKEVIRPTIAGLAAEGMAYTGFLYAGLMIGADGTPKVLEFNCRFGDPETQPVMVRLQSDLVTLCERAVNGDLAGVEPEWSGDAALGVVLAADGYPGKYRKGSRISGLDEAEALGAKVFHAGTRCDDEGRIVADGGRVLCVVATGPTVLEAQARAYAAVDAIDWPEGFCRRDIGHRAIAREKAG